MTIDNPGVTLPTSNERELLLSYLRAERGDVVRSADGLDEAQLRWTPDARLLPIIGVINHLTHVEWRWINGRYLGEPFPPRTKSSCSARRSPARRSSPPTPRAQRHRRDRARVPRAWTPCLGCEGDGPPADELLGLPQPIDLRWTVLHLIEETAHHAGHTDATRCSTAPAPTSCSEARHRARHVGWPFPPLSAARPAPTATPANVGG